MNEGMMRSDKNSLGQPIGFDVADWKPAVRPAHKVLTGRFCRLEPLDAAAHASDLFAANALDVEGRNWTYLPYGPFDSLPSYRSWVEQSSSTSDPLFFAIISNETGKTVGVASYLRIDPANGSIEVGHLNFSPLMQKTPIATEAMWLMMREAFLLGYRRYEWKCNALNQPSRSAAQRLGLSFEGVFRQAAVNKGRNRDTAWYAAIDGEWPALDEAFQKWLSPDNFDNAGMQRVSLSELTEPILVRRG
ncbi:N-acetyltransferase [Ferrigenium kumadai]|uniref:N-acetyltransferase n=1 Tax=Ferrigenium kumadai TaxID=1682490 RepID=A0AAN1VYW9_9PROT|nr:GNAT family protein [Ferrigenium kumadai]BBI98555.1 N-acetyltransferase [Ferrigenium kumadai]